MNLPHIVSALPRADTLRILSRSRTERFISNVTERNPSLNVRRGVADRTCRALAAVRSTWTEKYEASGISFMSRFLQLGEHTVITIVGARESAYISGK